MDWLKCFLWIALTRISSQHREEGSDANYLKIANNTMMKNMSYSVKPYPNNCSCHHQGAEIYNLAPLQNIDGTPRFATNSVLYINTDEKCLYAHGVDCNLDVPNLSNDFNRIWQVLTNRFR